MEMNYERGLVWRSSLGSFKTSRKMSKREAMTKHAIAEKIRRIGLKQRYREILRLFPNIHKRDKASILKEAVLRLHTLKNKTKHILDGPSEDPSKSSPFVHYLPNEDDDEATVITANAHGDDGVAKVTISCNQRASLNRELTEAIKMAGGKQIGVDMATIGGRTKVVATVKWMDGQDGFYTNRRHQIVSLTKAVRDLVANNQTSSSSSALSGLVGFGFSFR